MGEYCRRRGAGAAVAVVAAAALAIVLSLAAPPLPVGATPYRTPHAVEPMMFDLYTIDRNASGSYGLIEDDIENDGDSDLISFAYSGDAYGADVEGEVVWYRNIGSGSADTLPVFERRLLAKLPHVVKGDTGDIDGDGLTDLVFNSYFDVPPTDSYALAGALWWAQQPADVEAASEWAYYQIGAVVGNHRVQVGDFDGDGRLECLAVPAFGVGAGPWYGAAEVTLFYIDAGADPTDAAAWQSWLVTDEFTDIHDAVKVSRDSSMGTSGADGLDVMIASREGIHLLTLSRDDGAWQLAVTQLAGVPVDNNDEDIASSCAEPTECAYRDVGTIPMTTPQNDTLQGMHGVTTLSKPPRDGRRTPFIAAIDYTASSVPLPGQPWHGDTVSVYLPASGQQILDGDLQRQVLERRNGGGHVTHVVDIDDNGCPDVFAGFREYPTAFVLYLCDPAAAAEGGHAPVPYSFTKQLVSARSANALVVHDYNNDGMLDVVTCGFGAAGDNEVTMYINQGRMVSRDLLVNA